MPSTPALRPQLLALLSALMLASPAAHAADAPPGANAAAKPSARGGGLAFWIEGGSVLIQDSATAQIFRLHPVAAAVFVLANGNTAVSDIRKGAVDLTGQDVDDATVFGALDALADAKLLVARVTPPGGSDLDLVVLTDGALGTELVVPQPSSKAGAKVDAGKRKFAEHQAKKAHVQALQKESAAKRARPDIQKATAETAMAVKKLRELRQSEEGAKQTKKPQAEQASKNVAAARKLAKESAAKQSSVRHQESAQKAK
jgi:hypothetical protein